MSQLNSINEEALLLELQQGGRAAFEKVYKLYAPIMLNHAFRMLQNEEDARDVVQELFISLHENKSRLKDGTQISNFLFIALRNKIISMVRKEKTYVHYLDDYKKFANDHQHNILDYIYEKDLQVIIDKEICNMPPRMREIFEMSRKEYLSHKEIAKKLNISDQTVKTQIKNGLRIIRSKLPLSVMLIATVRMIITTIQN